MFKNKKGITWQTLVAVLLVIIGMAVLFPAVLNIGGMVTQSEDKACSMSLLLSSITKIGGQELISPECEHKTYVIGVKNLTQFAKTKNYNLKNSYVKDQKDDYLNYFDGESHANEWYLNEFMAKELKKCWDTVGRGSYDLFEQWWGFLDCSLPGEAPKSCDNKDSAINIALKSLKNKNKIPTFCLLCSSIHFEDEMKTQFPNKLEHLDEWLVNNPVPKTKIGYNTYLSTGTNVENIRSNFMSYNVLESQAIVYIKKQNTRVGDAINLFNNFLSTFGVNNPDSSKVDYVHYVKIINYKDLYNECSYLIG